MIARLVHWALELAQRANIILNNLQNKLKMSEIKNLKIGDLFSIRKNGIVYEFLGYCPIENLPIAFNRNKYETVYFEDENKKVYMQ